MNRSVINHTGRVAGLRHPLRTVKVTSNGTQVNTVPCPSCHKVEPIKALKVPSMWGYALGFCVDCYGNQDFQLLLAKHYLEFVARHGRPMTKQVGKSNYNGWATLTACDQLPCLQSFKKHMTALLGNVRLPEIHKELQLRYNL